MGTFFQLSNVNSFLIINTTLVKKQLLFLCAILLVVFTACGNKKVKGPNGITYNNAVEYNQYIVNKQTEVMHMVIAYIETVQTDPQRALDSLSVQAKEVDNIIKDLKGMPAYKGNTEMRDAAIESFNFYADVFRNEYKQMTELILSIDSTGATDEQMALNEKITADVTKREQVIVDKFLKSQKAFAKENRLKLEENKAEKEFEEKLNNLE
jgi:hypothetical protein